MSKETVKTQIDLDITNKTISKSISPLNVGSNMKAIVDLIPESGNVIKTIGSVIAISGSKATLQYDINTVNKSGGSEVKLPTTTEVGKEVLFLASNYAGTVSVYVNDAEDIKLSGGVNGISGNQQSLQISANEAYRFIYRINGYWYFEKIIDIPNNHYQLLSERSTDGTLVSNSNFKYPTEQAVKTYVDTAITNSLVNTAFTNIAYGAIILHAYDKLSPNIEIDITGNLDLTITGTVNGDSGLVNLYFSGTEVATLQGLTDLVITGASAMVTVYFIHDSDGLKWYNDSEVPTVDTSNLAVKEGTRLYHDLSSGYSQTLTNVGINCVASYIAPNMVGWEIIKANGEKAVIASITNFTDFTTVEPFATDSVGIVITAKAPSLWVKSDGALNISNKDGELKIALNADGSLKIGDSITQAANGIMNLTNLWSFGEMFFESSSSSVHVPQYGSFNSGLGTSVDVKLERYDAGVWVVKNGAGADGTLRANKLVMTSNSTYANDAAADADATLQSGSFYMITGDRTIKRKP